MSGTLMERFPLVERRGEWVGCLAELERRWGSGLSPKRWDDAWETVGRADELGDEEAARFAAALAWRRAMFIDDAWLEEELEIGGDSMLSRDREAFCHWAGGALGGVGRFVEGRNSEVRAADLVSAAEAVLANDFSGIGRGARGREGAGRWVHADGVVDWLPEDETIDHEVVLAGLRWYPMVALAGAWRETADERFLVGLKRLLTDAVWMVPGNLMHRVGARGVRTHWGVDALDVAIRTVNLITICGWISPALVRDADLMTLVWKIFYFCGVRGQEFWHRKNHNIAFYEASALGQLGFLFPAFRRSALWRDEAQRRLTGALEGSIMSDGSNVEGALRYHRAYVSTPRDVIDAAEANSLPLDPCFVDTYERQGRAAIAFWAKVVAPDRNLPGLGDGWRETIREDLARHGRLLASEIAQRVASLDVVANTAEPASCYLPVQRYAAMRSDWGPDAVWCSFTLRGFHEGHDHRDLFHVELQGGAASLLSDSGCVDYNLNRERSRASRAHNTLVVDDRDHGAGAAVDIRWETSEAFDWCEGLSVANPGVLHRRAVCFLKPDCIVILDRMHSHDGGAHTFDLGFHLPPECDLVTKEFAADWQDPTGWSANLTFHAGPGWTLVRENGFLATAYLVEVARPVVRFRAAGADAFTVAAVVRVGRPGANRAVSPSTELVPVTLCDAAGGASVPGGKAIALKVDDAFLLWREPGQGQVQCGDWQTDAGLLVCPNSNSSDPVFVRHASTLTYQSVARPMRGSVTNESSR